ncbi:Modification methylase HindIII [Anaerococcus prevotii]|uniref:DNA methylase N-4/N-6 domain protein n=1 Tax=Anaerococcus prevotii (strain ATCC 9321 / DSM 20548 / JCM 6508 / NCTC 11806 / PC1) TaxID=525919 RepID=C7RFY4_ANAPD|nr:site-specific DNA-methyltransferase [Anaerococcus prevotii]ACV28395.1 DNA methylase N-4/N-6 domain protein [Anaerococcus prevotii DSM 20548]SUU93954.1 Modification methylase HindIII [Anaerococcus prevotii]
MRFIDELSKVLSSDERFTGENNEIIKTKVSDAARFNDEKLLKTLLNNDLLKETFFTRVDDIYVFDKNKFVWVLESKEFLPDSFTMYKNKIGLVDSNNNLFSQKQDVSLVWPYKDCVLEGGQTKEDQKRDEIFYNETLAPDQVNRLLAPKVLGNAKRYTKDGIEENIEFKEDGNLIIKGNNLLALSSILKKYKGQIQMIYIDVPYYFNDTKEYDAFKYNSNFSFSTWLTFIKNRVELARELLTESGTLWFHVGEDGMHYVKTILDEIFGKEKFVGTMPRKTREGKNDVSFNFSQDFDFILIYTMGNKNDSVIRRKIQRSYIETDDFPGRPWRRGDIRQQKNYQERPNSYFDMVNPKTGKVYPVNKNSVWRVTKDTFDDWYKKGYIGFPDDYEFMTGEIPFRRSFKDEDEIRDLENGSSVFSDYILKEFVEQLMGKGKTAKKDIVNNEDFKYAKPESLLKSIIEISTKEDDIILDFFLGSGTTAAVSHKMRRHYIGIEQMNYINDLTIERLKKVIEGEQGGISKSVNWQGGGSFVYCELLEDNESLVNELEKAENTDQVKIVLNKAIDNGKLIPSILPSDLKVNEDDFDKLSLDDQKNLVMELLNKNQLYVNLSDIDDEDYKVSEADKAFTRSFYGKE